jgi:hypothetical protein
MLIETLIFSKGYPKFEQIDNLLGFFKVGVALTFQGIQAKIEN